jgi:tRNA dimethylallyltransferase
MQNPFFIVGQTAAGKTAAAIALAERAGAEIVGADAFQIYAGLALLTAKPTAPELVRVPHHLVGSVPLAETYNVARYRAESLLCLASIRQRGKLAIVAGGSGMYVKALTHGLSPLPAGDPALRAELEVLEPPELLARLRALDAASAHTIDARNKRRLVRAVEVCLVSGQPFSRQRDRWSAEPGPGQMGGLFLFRERAELHARIEARVEATFQAGVLEEVRALAGTPLGATAEGIIGLADIRLHLAGKLTLAACKERIKAATRQYAKRQMTWFKREPIFEPINLSQVAGRSRLAEIIGGADGLWL